MKPATFEYVRPDSLQVALKLLSTHENVKILAGGQSLMPMINMRFVLPNLVLDLGRIPGMNEIQLSGDNVFIGAMTRQREIIDSALLKDRCPILEEATRLIGHRQTRNWGTIGGSLCHLDPAAELPVVARALDAVVHIESIKGKRTLAISDLPIFYMTPAIEPDEIVTKIEFKSWKQGHGWGFAEFSRRAGDFAIVSAAAIIELEESKKVNRASLVIGGVGAGPVRCVDAENILRNQIVPNNFEDIYQCLKNIEVGEDAQASERYRRKLINVMVKRALLDAFSRAQKVFS